MQSRGNFCALWAFLFAFTTSQAQQWDWVQRLSSESSGTAIGVDGNQNVYVAGLFIGTNFLGTNRLASAGGQDVFLAKLNREGEVIWAISAGGPGDDSIGRLAVATNGALFVVGNFSIPAALLGNSDHSQDVSNVFVARVDDGRFTWFETLPAETGGIGGGVAFAPDESVWVVGASNRVFFKEYEQSGAVLRGFSVSSTSFRPTALAVNRDEQIFVSGIALPDPPVGTNIVATWTHLLAAIGEDGTVAWRTGWYYWEWASNPNPIHDIACTPDGGVVAVGAILQGFAWVATTVKYAASGESLWQKRKYASHKSVYEARGVVVDAQGHIHVTGRAVLHYMFPQPSDGLWLFSVDADGNPLSETSVGNRRYSNAGNVGTAIATTPDGAIYLTGQLTGSTFFGINAYDGGGAFVARRSFDRTNQIPILHAPKLSSAFGPYIVFTVLNHTNVVFKGSSVGFGAVFVDSDNDPLSYRWVDSNSGMPVAGDTAVKHAEPHEYNYEFIPSGDYVTFLSGPETFAVGRHAVEVIASDGFFSTTNRWAFEVMERDTLVQEFLTALHALGSDRAGGRTIAFWEAYLRAKEKGREHLAANRWKHFNRQLQRVISLSEEERAQLGYAAWVVQSLLLAE